MLDLWWGVHSLAESSEGTSAGFNDRQLNVLAGLNAAASALSLAGSGAIVLSYLAYSELKRFSFKLVFLLSIADVMDCVGSLFGRHPSESSPACIIQSWLVQFFSVASFLWTTVIAFVLYRTVVRHRTDSETLEPYFHAYVWGTSLIFAVIPQAFEVYGDAGFWCWIGDNIAHNQRSKDVDGHIFRLICFYIPLWLAIVWNAFAFISVLREIRMAMHLASYTSNEADKEQSQQFKTLQRLGFYPLILIGAYLFGTINRLYQFAPGNDPNFPLFALFVTTSSLKGFFNAIAYGFNPPVRKCISQSLETHCAPALRLARGCCRGLRSRTTREDFVQMEDMEDTEDHESLANRDALAENSASRASPDTLHDNH